MSPRRLAALYGSKAARRQQCPEQPPSIPDHPGRTVAPLVFGTPAHSPTRLARERPPSTASRARGSLTYSAPPKRTPCPSQATVGLALPHLQRKKNKPNMLVTPFWPDFFPIPSPPHFPWGRGGIMPQPLITSTETGHAVAETKMHPYSVFGAAVCTAFTPLVQKRGHSLPPNSNRAACQVSRAVFHRLTSAEASPPLKNKTWPIGNSWHKGICWTQTMPSSQEKKYFFQT